MLENQLFAATWSDLRCKCSKICAFWGLGAENAQKLPPQDWKWAFWVFELSPPILENSGLELKILENVFFETIWNVFRVWSWKYSKMQRAPHRETRHWPGSWVRSTSALYAISEWFCMVLHGGAQKHIFPCVFLNLFNQKQFRTFQIQNWIFEVIS